MGFTVVPSSARKSTGDEGRLTRHAFSFGVHYDPDNVGFGPMVVHNDDTLEPAAGYPDHPHSNTEIVTWVLDGVLVHTDSSGRRLELSPGDVHVTSAGEGIRHSEMADAASGPTRFVQTWLTPDTPGSTPTHAHERIDLAGPGWTTPVGGSGLRVDVAGAALHVARPVAGTHLELPAAPRLHLFVARGTIDLGGQLLDAGDTARIDGAGDVGSFGTDRDAEVLLWALP